MQDDENSLPVEDFDEDEAYNSILRALLSMENHRRGKSTAKVKTLERVSTEAGRSEFLSGGKIFGLHKLENTDHLFVQFTNERSPFIGEMKRRFEILNAEGDRVLFAVDQTGYLVNAFSYLSLHDFDFSFVDPNCGVEAFRLASRALFFGWRGTEIRVYKENSLLGTVLQSGQYGSTLFKILGTDGRIKYLVKPTKDYVEGIRPSFFQRLNSQEDIDIEFPEEFNILSADESVLVGRIMGKWTKDAEETVRSLSCSSDEDEDSGSSSPSNESDTGESVTPSLEDASTVSSARVSNLSSDPIEMDYIPLKDLQESRGFLYGGDEEPEEGLPIPTGKQRFNQERYNRFLDAIRMNAEGWEWYLDGEHFGAEINSQLGSVSRVLVLAVLLLQYFRIHYDRHHRRQSSRILYGKNLELWCMVAGIAGLLAFFVILMDLKSKSASA